MVTGPFISCSNSLSNRLIMKLNIFLIPTPALEMESRLAEFLLMRRLSPLPLVRQDYLPAITTYLSGHAALTIIGPCMRHSHFTSINPLQKRNIFLTQIRDPETETIL